MTWLIPIIGTLLGVGCGILAARYVSRREREVAENTAAVMVTLARGCEGEYGGGYRGTPSYDAYVAGIQTVAQVLERFQQDGLRIGTPQLVAVLRNGVRQRTRDSKWIQATEA